MKDIKLKFRKSSLFLYLLALALIVEGPTIWCSLTPTVLTGAAAKVIVYSLCVFYVLKNKSISYRGMQTSIFFLIYLTIYMFGARQGMERNISFSTQIVVPFVIYPVFCSTLIRNNDCRELLKAYTDIILFFAVISVFCWTFGTLLDILPFRRQVTYIWAGGVRRTAYTYFNLYYETDLQRLSTQLLNLGRLNRNVGIFCEAPGYADNLNLALAIEMLTNPKPNKKRIAILVITGITTFSVTAYIFMAMTFSLWLAFLSKTKKRIKLVLLYILVPVVLLMCFGVAAVLIKDKIGDASTSVRLDDLRAGLMTLRENPIWGVGFYDNYAILAYARVKRGNAGLSMGSTFMARGGLYMMLLYLGAIFMAFFSRALKPYKKELAVFSTLILFEFAVGGFGERQINLVMISMAYMYFVLGYRRKRDKLSNMSKRLVNRT